MTSPTPTMLSERLLRMSPSARAGFHGSAPPRKHRVAGIRVARPHDEEGAMAKRRKPTTQPPDPTFVTETALDAGVRAVEMTAAVARGLAKSALAAARAMSESFAQAAAETTRAAAGPATDGAGRTKRMAPRAAPRRRTSKKTQNRRRRAAWAACRGPP